MIGTQNPAHPTKPVYSLAESPSAKKRDIQNSGPVSIENWNIIGIIGYPVILNWGWSWWFCLDSFRKPMVFAIFFLFQHRVSWYFLRQTFLGKWGWHRLTQTWAPHQPNCNMRTHQQQVWWLTTDFGWWLMTAETYFTKSNMAFLRGTYLLNDCYKLLGTSTCQPPWYPSIDGNSLPTTPRMWMRQTTSG